MEPEMIVLHLRAGRICGEQATCGKKIRHPDESAAAKHANSLMRKGKARHPMEPYPCFFCGLWHVGRAMSIEELQPETGVEEVASSTASRSAADVPQGIERGYQMITCSTDWGTHGCSLAPGHEGDHLCLLLDRDDPRWVWVDTGDWYNFWDGKEIGFFYYVCDRRGDPGM